MKLSEALGPLEGLRFGLSIAFLPTLKAIFCQPWLLFSPRKISRVYMAKIWTLWGPGLDANCSDDKKTLITPHAQGRVLDLGAGHGHTVRYLDQARVSQYIALEPNTHMHAHIRAQAAEYGYNERDGTLVILSCGAEDTEIILSQLAAQPRSDSKLLLDAEQQGPPCDTIVSVLTLCTVPNPVKAINGLVRDILKPGGCFLMYEHTLSTRPDLAWWQRFWAPIWAFGFDGCRTDRPTDVFIAGVKSSSAGGADESAWKESRTWDQSGREDSLFRHRFGVFVKR